MFLIDDIALLGMYLYLIVQIVINGGVCFVLVDEYVSVGTFGILLVVQVTSSNLPSFPFIVE